MDKLSVWKRKVAKEERKRRERQLLVAKLAGYLDKTTFNCS